MYCRSAFAGSQIPQFMQQYSQRLAGHVAELQQLIDQLRSVAAHSNKSLRGIHSKNSRQFRRGIRPSGALYAGNGSKMGRAERRLRGI